MSIQIAGDMAKAARKEGMLEAAAIVDKCADRSMKEAELAHAVDDYSRYEELESEATLLTSIANKIRNRARR